MGDYIPVNAILRSFGYTALVKLNSSNKSAYKVSLGLFIETSLIHPLIPTQATAGSLFILKNFAVFSDQG